jgi:hypothetical protein
MTTTFENKATILANLWIEYRSDVSFSDFIEYNDLGLPLAYAIANGLIDTTDKVSPFIDEAFALLLEGLGQEDTGYESLEQLLSA